jgi:hypothetical protein
LIKINNVCHTNPISALWKNALKKEKNNTTLKLKKETENKIEVLRVAYQHIPAQPIFQDYHETESNNQGHA